MIATLGLGYSRDVSDEDGLTGAVDSHEGDGGMKDCPRAAVRTDPPTARMEMLKPSPRRKRFCRSNSGLAHLVPKWTSQLTLRLTLTTFVAVALLGCAAPGTPLIRAGVQDGEGRLLPGCKNVSGKYRVDNYITDFYLTTSSSAVLEGATQGVEQGYRDALAGMTSEPAQHSQDRTVVRRPELEIERRFPTSTAQIGRHP